MPFTAEYDNEADALYLRVEGSGERARTVEIDDVTYVDVDADGRAVGIELLYPSLGVNLGGLAEAFGLHADIPAIAQAIAGSGAAASIPTFTGGGAPLMKSAIVHTAVEGTVAAAGSEGYAVGVTHADQPILASC
jgi:uncharacterized protein YuzE